MSETWKRDRREFLKALAAGGAALGLGGTPAQARRKGKRSANERIEVGSIGVGGRGNVLLGQALENKEIKIVGISDPYEKRKRAAGEKAGGVKLYDTYRDLLDRPGLDAVIIATPDHWHAPIALDAILKGLDVYCEKPMTLTVDEARKVHAIVKDRGTVFQVGVQSLSWKKWWAIKEVVDQGMLGKVVCCQGSYSRNKPGGVWNWDIDAAAGPDAAGENHVDWEEWLGYAPKRSYDADRFFRFRKYWDYSGGIATDLHYHVLAPFHLVMGNEFPTRVAGMGGLWIHDDGREVPDTLLTATDYPGKYSITIQSSMANTEGPRTLIRGEKATLYAGADYEGDLRDNVEIVPQPEFEDEFKKKWGKDRFVIEDTSRVRSGIHLDNWVDCIRTRAKPHCNEEIAFTTMVGIGLCVRSQREGRLFHWDAASRSVRAG